MAGTERRGSFPCQNMGGVASFDGELYVYGGFPTERVNQAADNGLPYYSAKDNEEDFMMRLNKETKMWEPISYDGVSKDTWERTHCRSTGVVHQGKFYLTGTTLPHLPQDEQDDIRIFKFASQRWACVVTPEKPRGREGPLLCGHRDQLHPIWRA
ncbi:hypothetical protein WJX82_001014 [Trebouxia sp. C0006]